MSNCSTILALHCFCPLAHQVRYADTEILPLDLETTDLCPYIYLPLAELIASGSSRSGRSRGLKTFMLLTIICIGWHPCPTWCGTIPLYACHQCPGPRGAERSGPVAPLIMIACVLGVVYALQLQRCRIYYSILVSSHGLPAAGIAINIPLSLKHVDLKRLLTTMTSIEAYSRPTLTEVAKDLLAIKSALPVREDLPNFISQFTSDDPALPDPTPRYRLRPHPFPQVRPTAMVCFCIKQCANGVDALNTALS